MAKSKEYWEKRFEALEDAQMQKGASYFAELEKQYTKASSAVQSDIEKWYARFAVNNEITLQDARKMLTGRELEEFKWNVMEYIEKGRTLNHSTQWAKQLENASARFHVSRLEALKIQMQNHVEMLYGREQDELADLMEKIYTEGYYHTAYELQKGFNIGYSLMKLDKNKIEKVLAKPWAADGSNFSSRIWKQKSQLVSELHNNLTQAIIRGQNPSVVTDAIAKRFNVSKGQAGRLVMTESAFFASASNRDCYKDLDVEQYEILATLDTKTSDVCRALDGKVFPMSEYAVGVTAPPFHTWCRTTTVPFFDDEFELGSKRAARGEDGKTYHVPSNMKYEEWYEEFVLGDNPKRLRNETHKVRSEKEILASANDINNELNEIVKEKSLWNGKIEVKKKNAHCEVLDDFTLGIAKDASDVSVLHELLHTRSYAKHGKEVYLLHQGIEEASVEFLSREIAKKHSFSLGNPQNDILALQKVNDSIKIKANYYDFALELFNVELPERLGWLLRKINDSDASDTVKDELYDLLTRGGIID